MQGALASMTADLHRPNGLCFSPDESKLYIADSGALWGPTFDEDGAHHVMVCEVLSGGAGLSAPRVFANIPVGIPDGIRCDERGNIWAACGDGVNVFAEGTGDLVLKILTPKTSANCCFGGEDGRELLITANDKVWIVPTLVRGAVAAGLPGAKL